MGFGVRVRVGVTEERMEDEGAEEGGEDEGGRAHALAHGEDGDGR